MIAPAPNDPEHVTRQKQPEAPVAFELSLRADHPRGDDGYDHRGPLHPINHLVLVSRSFAARTTLPHAAARAAQSAPPVDERSYHSCRNARLASLRQSSRATDASG